MTSTNGDGTCSTQEAPKVCPEPTEGQFAEIDANADGEINAPGAGTVTE